jgi:hypothetical protein
MCDKKELHECKGGNCQSGKSEVNKPKSVTLIMEQRFENIMNREITLPENESNNEEENMK